MESFESTDDQDSDEEQDTYDHDIHAGMMNNSSAVLTWKYMQEHEEQKAAKLADVSCQFQSIDDYDKEEEFIARTMEMLAHTLYLDMDAFYAGQITPELFEVMRMISERVYQLQEEADDVKETEFYHILSNVIKRNDNTSTTKVLEKHVEKTLEKISDAAKQVADEYKTVVSDDSMKLFTKIIEETRHPGAKLLHVLGSNSKFVTNLLEMIQKDYPETKEPSEKHHGNKISKLVPFVGITI